MAPTVQVIRVGSRYGVSADGFVLKTFDSMKDAIIWASHVKEITK